MENLCDIIKQCYEEYKNCKNFILIHGAGSYGHFEAKEYKLNKDLFSHQDSKMGLVKCRSSVHVQRFLT